MPFEPKNFDNLLGISAFSDALLKNHFALYQGYVNNTNKLEAALCALLNGGKGAGSEFAELKRRFGWEFNGMRLHELYFGNMAKEGKAISKESGLAKQIMRDFGSLELWEMDFRATGSMRGIGWVVLYYDVVSLKLFNVWINEHDTGHLCGAVPILVMDVFEHAFMPDYGLKRAEYIDAFLKAVNWKEAEERLQCFG